MLKAAALLKSPAFLVPAALLLKLALAGLLLHAACSRR